MDGVTTTYNSVTATLLSGLTYRPFGESSAMNMGNGGTVSNTFDLNGRLTIANPGATMERDFTYDANGHLLTVTAAKTPWVNRTFAYDGLNRLTSATGPFGTFSYLYDDTGNRLSAVLGSRNETYGYFTGTNRLSEIDGTEETLYAYDTDGNTTSMGSLSLAWNREGRLIRVESGATPVSQYLYNAFGQRVLKSAGGLTTFYLYDFDGNLISETDGSGAIVTEYLYRGRVRLAMADRATGAVYTFHNNELGTPELMTDSTNTVVWEGISKPFGETAVNSGSTVVNNFRFQGQYYDAETGLHYNGQRYYDPKTGRYLTPDPIGLAGGVNPYVYVGDDPVNSVDPEGLWDFAYNAGFHLPTGPWPLSAGGNFSSELVRPFDYTGRLVSKGLTPEAVSGSWGDFGVSAGIADLSGTGNQAGPAISIGSGKYGGIQITLRKEFDPNGKWYDPLKYIDGVTVGLGLGLSFPVSVTVPIENLCGK